MRSVSPRVVLTPAVWHQARLIFGWPTMPLPKRVMFAPPAPVTARFQAEYSDTMALQPLQIQTTWRDGTLRVRAISTGRRSRREAALHSTKLR
jgi:hypothetical protein